MADVKEVAKYIINRLPVDNLKLQKLLYYSQAVYLVLHDGSPLFNDDIEAWIYGPVIRSIYKAYKKHGIDIIKQNQEELISLTSDEIEAIDFALEYYGKFTGPELINRTHQEAPWKSNFDSANNHKVIPNSDIYNYYKQYYEFS